MRYALIGFAVLMSLGVVLLYSACIVAKTADRREEQWFRERE